MPYEQPTTIGTITGRFPARSGHIDEISRHSQRAFSELRMMAANLKPRQRVLMNFHIKRVSLSHDETKRRVLKEVEYMLGYGASAKVARIWYVNRLKELKQ